MPKVGDKICEPQTLYEAVKEVIKAWRNFITLVGEELKIYKLLNFIENKLNDWGKL